MLALLGAAITAIWFIALSAMSLLTANPVTLNFMQIRKADYVVTALVNDANAGKITVEKEWVQGKDLKDVTVDNLSVTAAQSGGRYVIPLSQTPEGRLVVTPTPMSDRAPLIYPAEPADTSEQLERILKHDIAAP